MAITNEGVAFLAQAAIGQGTVFNNTNARIGVGNSDAAFDPSQNNLSGTETLRKSVDAGYPLVEPPIVKFRATFGPGDANFAWNEWGIFNAETGGVMLNRVVESNGTKQNNQTWVFEVAVTFAVG